ncbi:NAD(P)-binding protein [Wallemia mellicola]|nr:NAD(P)-binding protein [Wallemia mellicola]
MSQITLNFGLVGLGGITETFAKDILADPKERGVSDVKHNLVAVGSSSAKKADEFLQRVGAPSSAKGYGSYEGVYTDSNVQIVYIGTPHSHHYHNAKDALSNGKHVIVEKPAVISAPQMRALVDLAHSKRLFLMEAKWTRFFPMLQEISQKLHSGVIGDIKLVQADFGQTFVGLSPEHRIFNINLGGGSIMDLMPYPLIWVFSVLYYHPDNKLVKPEVRGASCIKNKYGVDENTHALLKFPGINADAVCTTNINIGSVSTLTVRGEKGELIIHDLPLSRPQSYEIRLRDVNHPSPDNQARKVEKFNFPIPNHVTIMDDNAINAIILNKKYQPLLSILKGARNGFVYGADINVIQGGNEALAQVTEIGESVKDLSINDWVVMGASQSGTWRSSAVLPSKDLIKVESNALSKVHGAMLSINPPTALRMLEDFVNLKSGDYIIQNGSNSAVGTAVIQIAKAMNIHTINLIRERETTEKTNQLVTELKNLGATHVLTNEEISQNSKQARESIKSWTQGKELKLALNCVGGKETTEIVKTLSEGAYLVTYGAMSKQPLTIPPGLHIFKNLQSVGFWMSRWYKDHTMNEKKTLISEIVKLIENGNLREPSHQIVKLEKGQTDEEATKALHDALASTQSSKILFEIDE